MTSAVPVTIAIPTYRRGKILLKTIATLLELDPPPAAILIVDQTEEHPADVQAELQRLSEAGEIRVIRLLQPSIPHAMNVALVEARTPLVLFVDDDVVPSTQLAAAHAAAHQKHDVAAVVGQVLQPDEAPTSIVQPADHLEFRFNSSLASEARNVMAGNLSVKRESALAIGGFDENFVGAAYRFETDFAFRLIASGHAIWFAPDASLHHLKLSSGGLRALGEHLSSSGPQHSVGDYYFALKHLSSPLPYMLRRLRKNLLTRYHLRHPWTIPSKAIGELRGLLLARKLAASAPRFISARCQPLEPD